MFDDPLEKFHKMGLVKHGRHLTWGWGHGHLMWAPYFVRRIIVKVWNFTSCRLFGHDVFEEMEWTEEDGSYFFIEKHCSACCKRFEKGL